MRLWQRTACSVVAARHARTGGLRGSAGHYLENLTKDSSAVGGNANGEIDLVHVR